MLIILTLLKGFLMLLSFVGYMLVVRRRFSIRWEFIPIAVFSSITLLVFCSGLAGYLYIGSLFGLIVGLLMFGGILFDWWRRGLLFRIRLSLGKICFFAGSLLFLFVLFQNKLTHYDNFSHWAIVLKQLLSTDAFPTANSPLIEFKNYPLGITSFLYYVCRFVGHSQSIMLVAQGLLIFSCFYAMFGVISEKKRFLLYAFLGFGLSTLSFFNITIRISNLLVDFLLPIFTLAIFAAVYQYRNDIKRACVVVLPIAGVLTVIKSTGIIFAVIGLIYLVYIWLTHLKRPVWKYILPVVGTIVGALLPYLGWNWRMKTVFAGIDNKFDVATSGLQMEKTPEQMNQISSLFLKSSMDITTRPSMGVFVFEVLAIAAASIAVVVFKKKWNLWKSLIALNVVMVVYYAGILGLYLYSMPLDEAIVLAGFERYASSIVVLFAGGLVLSATVDIERSFHYKIGEVPSYRAFKTVKTKDYYQKGIIMCIGIAAVLLLSEYNGIVTIAKSYDNTLPYKIEKITGDRWYNDGREDKQKYLFYASDTDMQVTNFYMQYVGRYYLYAPNVDGIVLFYEDNMDNLLSDYDYLVIVESDIGAKKLLKKHYGIDAQEGMYKVMRSDKKILLERYGQ